MRLALVVPLIVLSMTLIVGGDVAGKILAGMGFPPVFIAWARFGVAAIILLPFAGLQRAELGQFLNWRLALRAALIVGGIVGGAKTQIAEHAGVLLLATLLLHAIGFGLGYALARMLGLGVQEVRTISIEVGMQNSGLGSGLAKTPAFQAQFASATQAALAPVPAAISAVWHVLIGSILASWWRRKG